MLIKKRLKFSKSFFANLLSGANQKNYVYWIEDNEGNKKCKGFRLIDLESCGPFIILTESNDSKYVINVNAAIDTFYYHGNFTIEKLNNFYCIHNKDKIDEDLLLSSSGRKIASQFTLFAIDYAIPCIFVTQKGCLKYIANQFNSILDAIVYTPNLKGYTYEKMEGVDYTYNFGHDTIKEFIGIFEDDTRALMNTIGKIYCSKLPFDKIYPLNHDLYFVKNTDSGIGLADLEGNIIIEQKYKYAKPVSFNTNWIIFKKGGNYGVIDTKGNIIVDFEYTDIFEKNNQLVMRKDIVFENFQQ